MRVRVISFAAFLIAAAWGGPVFAEPIEIRFSHVVAENTPKGIGANLFKELAEERTEGRVEVTVFPNAIVANDDEVIDALVHGEIQMAAPSLGKFGGRTEVLQIFGLPFLFNDIQDVHRFRDSAVGQRLLDALVGQGIKGLAYWDNGMRVISANQPLRLPSDVAGLHFRVEPSDVEAAQFEILGAIPEKLPFSMVYEALETGLVDGQQNAWSNISSQNFHEIQRYFTETNHSYLGYMVITSVTFWDGLPADIREQLNEALRIATAEVNRIALEKSLEDRQRVVDSGQVEILTLSEEQREAWRTAMKPVWKRFEGVIGEEVLEAALASVANH
jgi:C4-dicarboxylate-binding protein DctP